MEKRLKQMKQMPSAFVCANDFIAVNVMKALKNNQIAIPGDIAVCGFDNAPESRIVEPHLSTVHIYSDEMGIAAANMLLSRVKEPALPYQVTHIQTKPIFRASTEKQTSFILLLKRTVLPVFGQNGSFGLSWSERQFILPFSVNDSIRRFHRISPKFTCAKLTQENA